MVSAFLLVIHGIAIGDRAAGERLATAPCVSCHSSTESIHSTLPLLEGQPKPAFIAQWLAFRERKRTAPAMVGLAEQLSEQEVNEDSTAGLLDGHRPLGVNALRNSDSLEIPARGPFPTSATFTGGQGVTLRGVAP